MRDPVSHEVHLLGAPVSCGSSFGDPVPPGIWLDRAYVRASDILRGYGKVRPASGAR